MQLTALKKASPDFSFDSFPTPFEASQYDSATEKIVCLLQENPEVNSIYLLGEVRDPGISDIDFLVSVEDNLPFGYVCNLRKTVKKVSNLADVSFIQTSLMPDLIKYAYLPNLVHRAGDKVIFKELSERYIEVRNVLLIFSAIVNRLFFLRSQLLSGRIRVRNVLLALNSLRYGNLPPLTTPKGNPL